MHLLHNTCVYQVARCRGVTLTQKHFFTWTVKTSKNKKPEEMILCSAASRLSAVSEWSHCYERCYISSLFFSWGVINMQANLANKHFANTTDLILREKAGSWCNRENQRNSESNGKRMEQRPAPLLCSPGWSWSGGVQKTGKQADANCKPAR